MGQSVWKPEMDNIIRSLWGKLSYDEIAQEINEYNYRIYHDARKSIRAVGGVGVIYRAVRIGIISEEEIGEHLYKRERRRLANKRLKG